MITVAVTLHDKPAYEMYIGAGFQDAGPSKSVDIGDGLGRNVLTLLLPLSWP